MATKAFKGFRLIVVDSLDQATDMDKIYFVRTNTGGTAIGSSTYKDEGYLFFNGKKYGNVKPSEDRIKALIGTIPPTANTATVIEYINKVVADKNVAAHGDGSYINASASNNEVGVTAITANLGNAMTWNTSTSALTVGTATSATGLATAADVDAKRVADEEAIINAFNNLKAGIAGLDATVSAETDLVHVEVVQTDGKLTSVAVSNLQKLNNVVASAETAVQTVTGDDYVSATKTGTDVALSAKTHAIDSATADTEGLATAYAVKNAILASAVTDVKYDSNTKIIQLYNGNTAVGNGFDASAFLVDGMLEDVEIVHQSGQTQGTYIHFIWNTDAGSKEMLLDVHELVDIYTVSGDSTDYLAISGYSIAAKTGSVSADTKGLAEAQETRDYIDDKFADATAAVNALNAELSGESNHVKVEFDQESGLVKDLQVTVTTAATASATAQADGLATAKDVKDYVDGQITALTDNLNATVSGKTDLVKVEVVQTDGKLSSVTVTDQTKLTNAVASAETAVQSVNGESGNTITLDASDIDLGANITSGQTVIASGTSAVSEVLQDIYAKLAAESAKTITSTDSSIMVSTTASGTDVIVNREATGSTTIEAGHVAIELNNNGALYGQMYYDGEDAV